MITKEKAIQEILKIQAGQGVNRKKFPDEMKGDIAKRKWDDPEFTYGLEYGKIMTLMETFTISVEDLRSSGEKDNFYETLICNITKVGGIEMEMSDIKSMTVQSLVDLLYPNRITFSSKITKKNNQLYKKA